MPAGSGGATWLHDDLDVDDAFANDVEVDHHIVGKQRNGPMVWTTERPLCVCLGVERLAEGVTTSTMLSNTQATYL